MRILLIEDSPELGQAISKALRREGFTVDLFDTVADGEEAWRLASYSSVILDLMLPDGSGLALLRGARAAGLAAPVLILTAIDGISDRIAGLDAGADDYLTKPFHTEELLARLRALMRRVALPILREIEIGSLLLDLEARTVRTGGDPLALSRSEFMALECLVRNQGRVCAKGTIADAIYGFNEDWSDGAIELHIHRLRRKLAARAGTPAIKALRGLGYMLVDQREA